ncbi:RICIN domain-containing protein [Streptomyces melanogenes]|uniref:RICIN domain-containing protein n=1 Tax=Streptomyces melanogenes TaxID=67326 RepID=UPI0037B53767
MTKPRMGGALGALALAVALLPVTTAATAAASAPGNTTLANAGAAAAVAQQFNDPGDPGDPGDDVPIGGQVELPATPGYDSVINYHSGKCLEVPGGSTADGVQLQQWSCNGKKHQKWNMRFARSYGGLRLYYVINEKSGKCLSVKGGSSANGTAIIQWPCHEGDQAEHFVLLKVLHAPGDTFVMQNIKTGKYPQVDGGSQANGAKVSLWKGQNKHHFWWHF